MFEIGSTSEQVTEYIKMNDEESGTQDVENSGQDSDSTGSDWEDQDSDYEADFSDDPDIESIDPSSVQQLISFGEISPLDGQPCVCKNVCDKINALSLMEVMVDISPNFDNLDCIIDNTIRCYNSIFPTSRKENINKLGKVNSYKIAFSDLFYRMRHEILFKILCMTLNLPVMHSDEKFSKYGIDSDRTPDLIIKQNEVLKIIEVTAVSSMEKASQNKGYDQMGFESKYKREIDMFNDMGVTCIYLPVFFDMSGSKNTVNKDQLSVLYSHFPKINESFRRLLETTSNKLAMLTINFRSSLILPDRKSVV